MTITPHLCTRFYALHSAYCIVQCTAQCILYCAVHCTVHIVLCSALHSAYCVQCTAQHTVNCAVHCTVSLTAHSVLFTMLTKAFCTTMSNIERFPVEIKPTKFAVAYFLRLLEQVHVRTGACFCYLDTQYSGRNEAELSRNNILNHQIMEY